MSAIQKLIEKYEKEKTHYKGANYRADYHAIYNDVIKDLRGLKQPDLESEEFYILLNNFSLVMSKNTIFNLDITLVNKALQSLKDYLTF